MIEHPAAVLARHLAAHAEDVCRHYLSNGSRAGRYWLVGDVQNSKGRSLSVRLGGPPGGPGAVGKWADTATGEPGDLLGLLRIRKTANRRVGNEHLSHCYSRWVVYN